MDHRMCLFSVIFFALLYRAQGVDDLLKPACKQKLNLFVEAQKKFDQCAVNNAVPVTMCHVCLEFYVEMIQAFNDLSTTPNPNQVRERCIDQFMNHDTLNIVWKQYQSSRNLWNSAACTNCFVDACNPDNLQPGSNVNEICQINSYVIGVYNRTESWIKCLDKSDLNNTNVCVDCLNAYNLVADQYHQLSKMSDGVCFEAVDQFNRTSNKWYIERKCPRPPVETSVGWIVIVVIGSLLLSAGLLSGGFYLFTKYRQQGIYVEQINSDSGTATPPIYT